MQVSLSRALGVFLRRALGGITGQFRGEFFRGRDARWSIWGFSGGGGGSRVPVNGQNDHVNASPGGAVMGGRRWEECSARVGQVTGACAQPKSLMQPFGVLLAHQFSQVA